MAHLPGDAGTCVIREWGGILVSWNPTPWGKPNWGVRKDAWAPPRISQLKVRPSGCPGQRLLGTGSPKKQSLLLSLLPPLFAPRGTFHLSPPFLRDSVAHLPRVPHLPSLHQILPLACSPALLVQSAAWQEGHG